MTNFQKKHDSQDSRDSQTRKLIVNKVLGISYTRLILFSPLNVLIRQIYPYVHFSAFPPL